MLQSTQGIVLHTTPFSETSIVAKIYTLQWGIQSFLINSVRSAKARNKAVLFQPLTVIELEAYHKPNRGLQKISRVHSVLSLHQGGTFDPAKAGIAFFIAEVIYRSMKEEQADAELFDFLISMIHHLLESTESIANYHLAFLLEFSRFLGFYPHYNPHDVAVYFDLKEAGFVAQQPMHQFYLNRTESQHIDTLMKAGIDGSHTLLLSKASRKILLAGMLDFYRLHMDHWHTIKSVEVLEDLFA